jgi:BASS family bile acid:Na+ symporter
VLSLAATDGLINVSDGLAVLCGTAVGSGLGTVELGWPYGKRPRTLAAGHALLGMVMTVTMMLTLPLWTALALQVFLGDAGQVPPPTRKVVEVALLVIVPVTLGMLVRAHRPRLADRAERPVRLLSTLLLGLLIAGAFASEWATVRKFAPVVGAACVLFNLASLGAGYLLPRVLKLGEPQAVAIAFEVGIHNGTLAIFIALEVLGRTQATIAPAIYSLSMYLTAALFAAWLLKRRRAAA